MRENVPLFFPFNCLKQISELMEKSDSNTKWQVSRRKRNRCVEVHNVVPQRGRYILALAGVVVVIIAKVAAIVLKRCYNCIDGSICLL